MLSFLLAIAMAFAPASPVPSEEFRALPEVQAVVVIGGEVVLLHDFDGVTFGTTTVPVADLVIVTGSLPNAFGFPALATPAGPQHELETTYSSARGTHTVRTNCRNYLTEAACVTAHARQLDAMQQVFRPV